MARLPARYSRAKSWAAPTTGQDFLRPVLYQAREVLTCGYVVWDERRLRAKPERRTGQDFPRLVLLRLCPCLFARQPVIQSQPAIVRSAVPDTSYPARLRMRRPPFVASRARAVCRRSRAAAPSGSAGYGREEFGLDRHAALLRARGPVADDAVLQRD